MKKLGRKILIFIPFSFFIYFVAIIIIGEFAPVKIQNKVNFAYEPLGSGHMYTRLKDVSKFKDIDVLVLGSSHAYRGFDPRIFKKHDLILFNLGSSSQSPIETKMLVERLSPQLNPKLVIFEVYPNVLNSDGLESYIDILGNDQLTFSNVLLGFKLESITAINAIIFRIWKEISGQYANYKEDSIKRKKLVKPGYILDKYIKGGYVELVDGPDYDPKPSNVTRTWEISEKQFDAFEDIVKYYKNRDIEIILVQNPLYKDFYNSYTNNDFIDSIYSSYAKYYNLNKLIDPLPKKFFWDHHHLNQEGVEFVNPKLIDLLEKDSYIDK